MGVYYDTFCIYLKSKQFRNEASISAEHIAIFNLSASEMLGGKAFPVNQSSWPILRLSIHAAFALVIVVFVPCSLNCQLESYLRKCVYLHI